MKKGIHVVRFVIALVSFVFLFSINTMAGDTEPGDPGTDPVGSPPLGGGAPVGGGILLLIGLGLAYGGKKAYQVIVESKEESKEELKD